MAQYLALTSEGIENLLFKEIQSLGATEVKQSVHSVSFSADQNTAYKICLSSRYASRVLRFIGSFEVKNPKQLYSAAKSLDWQMFMRVSQSFAIDFTGTNSFIKNTQFGGLTVKDAIADYFVEEFEHRPSVDKYQPDVRINVRLRKEKAAFYLDFSGPSLHQRGYRSGQGAAPLKENLAAAIIERSGWLADTSQPLLDPFCGSGTLLIEAAMMANNMAPGLLREDFAFEQHLDFNAQAFNAVKDSVRSLQKDIDELNIAGSDVDPRVLNTAKENAAHAGVGQLIRFSKSDAAKVKKQQAGEGVVVCNPPYGERMGNVNDLAYLYSNFSISLKQQFVGWRLAFFTQDVSPVKQLRMAKSKSYKFRNGPLDCLLYLYELDERQCRLNPEGQQAGQVVLNFEQSDSFANRLKKNDKKYRSDAKRANVNCYRIYDADIPEYNVAVDRYADHVVVFEYAPPKSVDESVAQKRLDDVMLLIPKVLDLPASKVALKVRERKKGANQYNKMDKRNETFEVEEYGIKLWVNIHDYLDTGVFLDHRITRGLIGKMAKGKSVLNLFAYTGAASVHAAAGGASSVTTVDMSNTYLDWAKRNFELNRLKGRQYQFVQSDVLGWIDNAQEDDKARYDVIFIDPPTFSNSKRMDKTFDVLRDHGELLSKLKGLLIPGGTIVFSNNHRRFKIDSETLEQAGFVIEDITPQTIDFDFKRNSKIHNCWTLKHDA